ncbi:proline--tRNA ligase [Sulfurospirillum sp. hDNRA2]|uniref:proline--tRNA ligase n=1 Tax=Sulfurospirillum sp. hDNRA2 TaxID=3237298 RepID=UPI0020B75D29|nr:proline--tRNA ligase [Sulfurospirillum sp. DNRA8]MCP3651058.1 proline--tRNA ligase [Sulfurospirillum sp. DNRA8]MCR1809904.1 proline--tRNA ligase [Sulfurospirillum sp. DNRA8]
MKFSKLYAPTTKDAPKDATLPSHQYLVRGGFISQVGSGLYNFLPMGKIVFDKIKNVVKEEMDKTGAQEIQMDVVTPAELWKQSGRYDVFGKELCRFKDRKDNEFVLGPTHEEVVVDIVRNRINSYKQLPLHLYQITTKFRDEARPRFGLLRGREFTMKDGYSFHEDEACMKQEFDVMEKTYTKIFTRLGLDFRAVEADSGAIGGSGSKEFMVLAQNGEDDIVVCQSCAYAANVEAAKRAPKTTNAQAPEANFGKFKTPDMKTIDDVSDFFKVDPFYSIKAVVKKAIYVDKEEVVVFFVRGNDELQETKAQNACGALDLVDASLEEVEKAGLYAGFIGPIGLENVRFYIDFELKEAKNLICGANEVDYHFVGVSMFNFKEERYKDLISVHADDRCACCGGVLHVTKGIEVGHIFQLGQKYAKAMGATFLDKNGKAQPFYMGCYGIGVSRLVAVMIEASHDDKGCIWNKQTAPYVLDIIVSNSKDEAQNAFAEAMYTKLQDEGVNVLWDDRNERFGFKMKDFELIGFPYALIVGKELEEGFVEIVERKTLDKTVVKKEDAYAALKELLA